MIEFNYETEFALSNSTVVSKWIEDVISNEGCSVGEVNYIFCDDAYLHKLNVSYLNHDTYTDIISFDTSADACISGDIFISIERVEENAKLYKVTFEQELHRVMIHGVLHYLGYKDKLEEEQLEMTKMENESLLMLTI